MLPIAATSSLVSAAPWIPSCPTNASLPPSLAFSAVVPAAEITVDSAAEIVFRLYGLEFARARLTPMAGSFRNSESILFGIGRPSTCSTRPPQPLFGELVHGSSPSNAMPAARYQPVLPAGSRALAGKPDHRDVRAIDERLDRRFVYSQVPAFAASDRAMLDVLTCTLDGRWLFWN